MQQQVFVSRGGLCSVASPLSRNKQSVRAQAVSGTEPAPAFKLPKKPFPKDPETVRKLIAKSHEIHGQGRSMWFSLTGSGKRATAGTYLVHADIVDWNAVSSGSVDSYNIYS